DFGRPLGTKPLHFQAVVLNLDVKVVTEHPSEPLGQTGGFVELVLEHQLTEFAGGAAAQADNSLTMRGEQFLINAGNVVIALQESDGGHLREVAESGAVARQEREMVARFAASPGFAVAPLAGGDVRLVADDRIDGCLAALAIEFDGPVEVAVVRQSAGVHAQFLDASSQLGNAAGPVEQAVMAVAVQVNERALRHVAPSTSRATERMLAAMAARSWRGRRFP